MTSSWRSGAVWAIPCCCVLRCSRPAASQNPSFRRINPEGGFPIGLCTRTQRPDESQNQGRVQPNQKAACLLRRGRSSACRFSFLLRGPAGNSVAAMCMMLVMLPSSSCWRCMKNTASPWKRSSATSSRWPSSGPSSAPTRPTTSMPCWSGRQISTRRCMTLFAANKWRQAVRTGRAADRKQSKKKLTRADTQTDRGSDCPRQPHGQKGTVRPGQHPL